MSQRRNFKRNGKKGYKSTATKKTDQKQDKQIIKLSKDVKALKNIPEVKFFDTQAADQIITNISSGFMMHLTNMAQGITTSTRIGDSINAKYLHIKYTAFVPGGEMDPAWFRIMVVCDRQSNINGPTLLVSVSDNGILDNTIVTRPWLSFHNDSASDRFKIYKDKIHTIHQIGVRDFDVTTGDMRLALNMPFHGEFFVPINRVIKYGSGTATFPVTNALYVVMTSDQPGTDEAPTVTVAARLAYTDQ